MRLVAGLSLALLAGCSSGAGVRPDTTPAAARGPTGPVDFETECERVGRLVEAGDHKPAVDALTGVERAGGSCGAAVTQAAGESRRIVAAADELARRGLEQRAAGDRSAAAESFRQALAIYPRYHWVRKLADHLREDPASEAAALRKRAAELRASGRPEEALETLQRAHELAPADNEIAADLARGRAQLCDTYLVEARRAQQADDLESAFAWTEKALSLRPGEGPSRSRLLDHTRRIGLTLFSAGELLKVKALWRAALALDPDDDVLRQYLAEVEARLQSLDRIQAGDG